MIQVHGPKEERVRYLIARRSVALLFAGLVPLLCTIAFAGKPKVCKKPPHRPKACVGYVKPDYWGHEAHLCPPNHAIYGVDDPAGDNEPEYYPVRGSCCPLPATDILTKDHVWEPIACPHPYVATGVDNHHGVKYIRCTRINTNRYRLGAQTHPYFYWGDGDAGDTGAIRVNTSTIPAAIRPAHGRNNYRSWGSDGCVAGLDERSSDPTKWSGLFVARTGKNCPNMFFRRLFFQGIKGDPPSGTVVRLFPRCHGAPNPYDRYASCPGAPPRFPCEDGRDNDGDGLIDEEDPGCACAEDTEDNPKIQCDNLKDDDRDGFIDMRDPDCESPLDDSEFPIWFDPVGESLTPATGESRPNEYVTFTATFSDSDGWQDLEEVGAVIHG